MTEKVRRPYRRRHYFINRKLQGKFTFIFLILGFMVVAGTSAMIWRFSSAELTKYIYRSHVAPVEPWDVVFPILVKSLLFSVLALIVATYLFTRLLFRRMSSAMMSFNEALMRMSAGDLATEVPEGGVDDLNRLLDMARENLRVKIAALRDLQKEMAIETAKAGTLKESMRKEVERLCYAFRKDLSEFYDGETNRK